jgi:hypothetical protein
MMPSLHYIPAAVGALTGAGLVIYVSFLKLRVNELVAGTSRLSSSLDRSNSLCTRYVAQLARKDYEYSLEIKQLTRERNKWRSMCLENDAHRLRSVELLTSAFKCMEPGTEVWTETHQFLTGPMQPVEALLQELNVWRNKAALSEVELPDAPQKIDL